MTVENVVERSPPPKADEPLPGVSGRPAASSCTISPLDLKSEIWASLASPTTKASVLPLEPRICSAAEISDSCIPKAITRPDMKASTKVSRYNLKQILFIYSPRLATSQAKTSTPRFKAAPCAQPMSGCVCRLARRQGSYNSVGGEKELHQGECSSSCWAVSHARCDPGEGFC